jgi:U3 small nucleolar RNA-associated protein 14
LYYYEKKKKIIVKAGWGDWAGPGAMKVSKKILSIRDRMITKIHTEHEQKKSLRLDTKKPNVIISEERLKNEAKYKIGEIPHPFTTREEYENSLLMPIGGFFFYYYYYYFY